MHVECPRCDAVSVVPLRYGEFLLLNVIGVGGSGTVFRAIDLPLSRFVAVKVLRHKLSSNPDAVERFAHEARAAAALSHPNIAQVYTFAALDGHYYLAMELLERGSLDDRINRLGKLPEHETLELGLQIADALRAAHRQGLLHRDVKPGNILFDAEGVPKIVDFGLVRAHAPVPKPGAPADATPTGHVWGTPYYVAPEKLEGQPEDVRSDIYSLGATLHHALCGRPPAEATPLGQAAPPAASIRAYAPGADLLTVTLISRMLARNPTDRYADYDELIRDIEQTRAALRGQAKPPAAGEPSRRRRTIVIAVVAGLIAGLIAGALLARLLLTLST